MIAEKVLFPRGKRLALLFTGESRLDIPREDRALTVWAHPATAEWALTEGVHVDVWFDLHRYSIWHSKKPWRQTCSYVTWLARLRQPILMQRHYKTVPTSLAYPIASIANQGVAFHGTFDWMMALALGYRLDSITLYGVEYDTPHEHIYQKVGAAYWIGRAQGKGIPVYFANPHLLETPMGDKRYGPDYPPWPKGHHPDDYPEEWA